AATADLATSLVEVFLAAMLHHPSSSESCSLFLRLPPLPFVRPTGGGMVSLVPRAGGGSDGLATGLPFAPPPPSPPLPPSSSPSSASKLLTKLGSALRKAVSIFLLSCARITLIADATSGMYRSKRPRRFPSLSARACART